MAVRAGLARLRLNRPSTRMAATLPLGTTGTGVERPGRVAAAPTLRPNVQHPSRAMVPVLGRMRTGMGPTGKGMVGLVRALLRTPMLWWIHLGAAMKVCRAPREGVHLVTGRAMQRAPALVRLGERVRAVVPHTVAAGLPRPAAAVAAAAAQCTWVLLGHCACSP